MSLPAWLTDFLAAERLPASFAEQVAGLHAPLAEAIVAAVREQDEPFVLGLCGPQGSGKSTMVEMLCRLIADEGLRVGLLSIDDLYLTRAEREALAREVHPLLLTRGPPGTHDVALGIALIEAVKRGEAVRLVRFDKAVDDRRPEAEWPAPAAFDVLLFEGWCVGARAEAEIDPPINALEREEDGDGRWRRFVNAALARDYPALWAPIDALVMLEAPRWETVAGWREEQEAKLRRVAGAGKRVMSPAEVGRFVQFYERTSRAIAAEMPGRADIVIALDERRVPTAIRVRAGSMLPLARP